MGSASPREKFVRNLNEANIQSKVTLLAGGVYKINVNR